MTTLTDVQKSTISAEINRIADDAARRCGASDHLFTDFLSSGADRYMDGLASEEERIFALERAKAAGYATEEERDEADDFNEQHGLCSHGLDPDCCPLGCGDR